MDIASLCLMEYKKSSWIVSFSQQSYFCDINFWGFLDIPEILSQSENSSSDELSCEYLCGTTVSELL